ncbi:Profilin-3 [Trichinella spiralis]|uniref:Profilin n=1 Tax=Trichinella spiralis TaxID=6334 RepID=A0ABR3K6W5_TRISP
MSWNDLVQNNLIGTQCVSKAAICSLDGQIWGVSENFQLTQQEALAAANAFKNKEGIQANGLKLEGKKYFVYKLTMSVLLENVNRVDFLFTKLLRQSSYPSIRMEFSRSSAANTLGH